MNLRASAKFIKISSCKVAENTCLTVTSYYCILAVAILLLVASRVTSWLQTGLFFEASGVIFTWG